MNGTIGLDGTVGLVGGVQVMGEGGNMTAMDDSAYKDLVGGLEGNTSGNAAAAAAGNPAQPGP